MTKLPPQVLQTLSKDINMVCDLAFRQAGAEPLQSINRISSGFSAVVKFVDEASKLIEQKEKEAADVGKTNPPSNDSAQNEESAGAAQGDTKEA